MPVEVEGWSVRGRHAVGEVGMLGGENFEDWTDADVT